MNQIATIPRIGIELGGATLSPQDTLSLTEVRVQQRLSLPALCELTFLQPAGTLADDAPSSAGSSLKVTAGENNEVLFEGEVTAIEYTYDPSNGKEIRLRGYDRLHRLRKRQPVRAHVEVTAADLAKELTGDLGVSVEATDPGPVWKRIAQYRQSDFDLLFEVTERCGLYFTLRDNTLELLTLEGTGSPVELVLGDSLLEARFEVNGDLSCRSVAVAGWDPLRITRHSGDSSSPRVGRDVSAEADPSGLGGTGERTLADETAQDDRQAEVMAQAELDYRAAKETTLWGVADGSVDLKPGSVIDVQRVASSFEGKYVLTAVNHTIDPVTGFTSEFSTAPPAPRVRPSATVAALGIVTQVDDPDKMGRVKVTLPTYGDIETDWMCVLAPAAGAQKGLVALPDVDDQVLVLFVRQDPTQGVVLGGLFGEKEGPEWGEDNGAIKRYTFQTRGGQRIQLDDIKKSLRLENNDGSYIEMSPKKVVMHSERNLEIEAPGSSIIVRGQKIDFERA